MQVHVVYRPKIVVWLLWSGKIWNRTCKWLLSTLVKSLSSMSSTSWVTVKLSGLHRSPVRRIKYLLMHIMMQYRRTHSTRHNSFDNLLLYIILQTIVAILSIVHVAASVIASGVQRTWTYVNVRYCVVVNPTYKSASVTHRAMKFACVTKCMHSLPVNQGFQRYSLLICRLSFALPLLSLFWCLASGWHCPIRTITMPCCAL